MTAQAVDSTRYLTVGPTRIRVRTIGTGPPLVMLMGVGGHVEMWQPLVEQLSDRQIVMFDFPGTGESGLPWFPPTMAHSAFFVSQLMRRLRIDEADFLGYSWGGLLAQQLAAQHPRKVRRLILACTGPGVFCIPADLRVAARLATPRRYYSPAYLARIAPDTYGGKFRYSPELVHAETARRMHHPPSWTGYAFQLVSAGTFSTLPIAALIKQPTLIIGGDDDPIVKTPNQYILHRLIRTSELRILAGGGHLLLLDSADEAAPIITSFLTDGDHP